jgi:hypothetical protein
LKNHVHPLLSLPAIATPKVLTRLQAGKAGGHNSSNACLRSQRLDFFCYHSRSLDFFF